MDEGKLEIIKAWTTSIEIHDNGDDTVYVRIKCGKRAAYCNSFMTMHLAIGNVYIWLQKYIRKECESIERGRVS